MSHLMMGTHSCNTGSRLTRVFAHDVNHALGDSGVSPGEQQPPRPPTLWLTPHFPPRHLRPPCRPLVVRRLPTLPGLPATLSLPAMAPWCRVTPTWPPRPWWLRRVRGCRRSAGGDGGASERASQEAAAAPQATCWVDVKEDKDSAHLPTDLELPQALVCLLQTDLSVK